MRRGLSWESLAASCATAPRRRASCQRRAWAAAVGRESGAQVEIAEASGERAFGAGVALEQRAQEVAQAESEFVYPLGLAPHGAVQQSQGPIDGLLLPAARQHSQVVAHGVHQLLLEAGD